MQYRSSLQPTTYPSLVRKNRQKAVGKILHSTPLSAVLPFYAGLTGLSNEGACGILLEVTEYPLDQIAVELAMQHTLHESSDRRRLLLALLNCIYEAQKPSICKLVNPPLHPKLIRIFQERRHAGIMTDDSVRVTLLYISFDYLGLDAVDCLSLLYSQKVCCV